MSKKIKIPIDEFGEGNCCPECGSLKVHIYYQYPLYVYEDLEGHELFHDPITGKWTRNVSNKEKARLYKLSQNDAQMWQYTCRKCGWTSKLFVP